MQMTHETHTNTLAPGQMRYVTGALVMHVTCVRDVKMSDWSH